MAKGYRVSLPQNGQRAGAHLQVTVDGHIFFQPHGNISALGHSLYRSAQLLFCGDVIFGIRRGRHHRQQQHQRQQRQNCFQCLFHVVFSLSLFYFLPAGGFVFVCKHEEAPWGFGHTHFSTIFSAVPVPLRYFLYKFPPHFCASCNIWYTSCKKTPPKAAAFGGFS